MESDVAICLLVDNPNESAEGFKAVMDHLGASGPVPPAGASLMVAGAIEGAWRVISVWDSGDAMQRFFGERLAPAYRAAGLSLEAARQSTFEVHMLVARPHERPA